MASAISIGIWALTIGVCVLALAARQRGST
jgi:hypothetical protein